MTITYVQLKAMKHNNSCTYQKLKKTTYHIMNRIELLNCIQYILHNTMKTSTVLSIKANKYGGANAADTGKHGNTHMPF